MGRGYIGESGGDRALNKMIKHMEKSARDQKTVKTDDSIIAQLKALYPTTWREELAEIRLEGDNPEYLVAKNAARELFKNRYQAMGRAERSSTGLTEAAYVSRNLRNWIRENRKSYE